MIKGKQASAGRGNDKHDGEGEKKPGYHHSQPVTITGLDKPVPAGGQAAVEGGSFEPRPPWLGS